MTTANKKSPKVPAADTTADTPAENTNTGVATATQYPSWFAESLNKRTGELEMKSKYPYLEGMPKEFRFDGRNGQYNQIGRAATDSFTIRPVAFRFFEDEILGMVGRKEWVEIIGMDDTNAVSAILFHTHSLKNLREMIAPLFYEDMTLVDIVLTCTSSKHKNEKAAGKPEYFLAEFAFEPAPAEEVTERLEFANTVRLYRRQTATANAVISASFNYFDSYNQPEVADSDDSASSAEVEI